MMNHGAVWLLLILIAGCSFDHPEPATTLMRIESVAAEQLRTKDMSMEQYQGVMWCTERVRSWHGLETVSYIGCLLCKEPKP